MRGRHSSSVKQVTEAAIGRDFGCYDAAEETARALMSKEPVSLPVRGHPRLRITTRSGRVAVVAEDRADIYVPDGESIGEVVVDDEGAVAITSANGGSARMELRCPTGSDVRVGTGSGRVELRGELGHVHVTTASGSVAVDRVASADLRSVSGSVSVGSCSQLCRLQTKTGRAEVGNAERAEVSTVSGRVTVDRAKGEVQVRTATGAVEVGTAGSNDVAVQTLSGAVTVRVPSGVRPAARLKSLTGRLRCDCEEGSDCSVSVSTMSGKVEVVPS